MKVKFEGSFSHPLQQHKRGQEIASLLGIGSTTLEAHQQEKLVTLVKEDYETNPLIFPELTTSELNDIKLTLSPNQTQLSVAMSGGTPANIIITGKATTINYECFSIQANNTFILLDPDTNEIYHYQKPNGVQAFLVEEPQGYSSIVDYIS